MSTLERTLNFLYNRPGLTISYDLNIRVRAVSLNYVASLIEPECCKKRPWCCRKVIGTVRSTQAREWALDPTIHISWISLVFSCAGFDWPPWLSVQPWTSRASYRNKIIKKMKIKVIPNWLYLNEENFGTFDRPASLIEDVGTDDDILTRKIFDS